MAISRERARDGEHGLKVTFDGAKSVWGGSWVIKGEAELEVVRFGGEILVDVFVAKGESSRALQLGLAFQEVAPNKKSTWQQHWTHIGKRDVWQTIRLPFERSLFQQAVVRIQDQ